MITPSHRSCAAGERALTTTSAGLANAGLANDGDLASNDHHVGLCACPEGKGADVGAGVPASSDHHVAPFANLEGKDVGVGESGLESNDPRKDQGACREGNGPNPPLEPLSSDQHQHR